MPEAKWRRYLRFWRPSIDADLDDELRFHMVLMGALLGALASVLPAWRASRVDPLDALRAD